MSNKDNLPDGWKWVRLGDVCNFISGFAFKKEYLVHSRIDDNYLPVVKIGSFNKNGNISASNFDFYKYTEELHNYLINKNDALVAMTGATVGKVAVSQLNDYLLNQRVGVIRHNKHSNQNYLNNVLMTNDFYEYCQKIAEGGAQGNISPQYIMNYTFPLPPLPEQRRIAAIIDKKLAAVEKAKKAAEEQKKAVGALVEAYLREAFEFAELPEGWRRLKLGKVCDFFSDGNWIESKDQSPSGIRLLQVGNIGNGVFVDKNTSARYISEETYNRLNCTEVIPGDILISRLPKPVGRACIVPETSTRMITAVDCTIVRVNQNFCISSFLLSILMTDDYFNQVNSMLAGATRERISRSKLETIEIPLPPLAEQRQIVAIIDKKLAAVEKVKKAVIEQTALIDAMPGSVLRRAFNGEL
jgi:type I restriction enzyme S subunit